MIAACSGGTATPDGAGQADGAATDATTPDGMPVAGCITALAAGSQHYCLLDSKGVVACFGGDIAGELGAGVAGYDRANAVPVEGLPGLIVDVALGTIHTCALMVEGEVWCWGGNSDGQLGRDVGSNGLVPAPVVLPGPAIDVGAGVGHTCAVLATGEVLCWGGNWYGQLGRGMVDDLPHPDPQIVAGAGPATSVAGGYGFGCARRGDGTVSCWGSNSSGQLGAPGPDRPTAAPVPGAAGVDTISIGWDDVCAILASGSLTCWGRRHGPSSPVPVTSPVSVESGEWHVCAVSTAGMEDGAVHCWGDNNEWQLGNPNPSSTSTPTQVALPSAASHVAAGRFSACAATAAGVYCWGDIGWEQPPIVDGPDPVLIAGTACTP